MNSLQDRLLGAKGWDEQMRELMLGSRQLAVLPEPDRQAEYELQGCESQVWLKCQISDGRLHLWAWSTSKIVRGLLAVMFEPLQDNSPEFVCQFDMASYLQSLGLARHLSQSRSNGLQAVMEEIRRNCR
ncbi:SufE family protein [Bowmanella dokdonensis]|uniref:SufE family protein n=1 Tax=Bowmanella dokdonensis TaxID=751969 RepID=A0A939INT0_9ALTE|nr:SufE family protein [Bowmanella dokdonensis]MBN7825165.1 SufE family protein [Bowmanella dokdonensis]